jgi:hypothetical protein
MADYSAPLEHDGGNIALEVNIPMSHMDHFDVNSNGRLKNQWRRKKKWHATLAGGGVTFSTYGR